MNCGDIDDDSVNASNVDDSYGTNTRASDVKSYGGVGRWYKLVSGSSNGGPTDAVASKGKHKKGKDEDSHFHSTESEYILVNVLYMPAIQHSNKLSRSLSDNLQSTALDSVSATLTPASTPNSSPRSTQSHYSSASVTSSTISGASQKPHKAFIRSVMRSEQMLCELFPPSDPHFRHLYIDLSPTVSGKNYHDISAISHILPGPCYGEIVLDKRDNVEWRVSAGVNLFGDPIYTLCLGTLVVTDLRVIFMPFYLNCSFWANGAAVFVSGIEDLGMNKASESQRTEEDSIAVLSRYTYQIYHSSLYDCRCSPTPTTGALEGKEGVGAFLERCHAEYANLLVYGCRDLWDNCDVTRPRKSSIGYSVNNTERYKNSYNLVFEASDDSVVEFTVPMLQKVVRQSEQGTLSQIQNFLRDNRSTEHGDLESDDEEGSGGEDTEDENEDIRHRDISREKKDGVIIPAEGKLSPRVRSLSAEELHKNYEIEEFERGLLTATIQPIVWCHRVCDTCIWLARSDRSWVLWTKYLQASAERYVHASPARSPTQSESVPDTDANSNVAVPSDQGFTHTQPSKVSWLQRVRQPLNPDTDYQRMRVLESGWRMYDGNNSYEEIPSYPQIIYVPEELSDDDIYRVTAQRSSGRVQALVWIHPTTKTPLLRSSQPLAGMQYSKLEADIQMLLSIRRCSLSALMYAADHKKGTEGGKMLRIADARPKINANANALKGGGTESVAVLGAGMATLHFLDVENIHTMRFSLARLKLGLVQTAWGWTGGRGEAITYSGGTGSSAGSSYYGTGYFSASTTPAGEDDGDHETGVMVSEPKKMDTEIMSQSSWQVHLSLLLKGAAGICESLVGGHPVLIHCTDGWDRTSQLSSLAQLMLDPYYRTIQGFLMLIQKDWCSFGHQFEHRIKLEVNPHARTNLGDLLIETSRPAMRSGTSEFYGSLPGVGAGSARQGAKSRDLSPVFVQFIDCVYQLHVQFPTYFEFSERFLVIVAQAAQNGVFSTFRENSEKCRFALMRHVSKKENMSHIDLQYSTLGFYIAAISKVELNGQTAGLSSVSEDSSECPLHNKLYTPPRARDRRIQYLRPRCSGPHDLVLWRNGLCGFTDPYVGMLTDPSSYNFSMDERLRQKACRLQSPIHNHQYLTSCDKNYCRDIIEHLVEDVLDLCTRSFYSEMKHLNKVYEKSGRNRAATTNTVPSSSSPDPSQRAARPVSLMTPAIASQPSTSSANTNTRSFHGYDGYGPAKARAAPVSPVTNHQAPNSTPSITGSRRIDSKDEDHDTEEEVALRRSALLHREEWEDDEVDDNEGGFEETTMQSKTSTIETAFSVDEIKRRAAVAAGITKAPKKFGWW